MGMLRKSNRVGPAPVQSGIRPKSPRSAPKPKSKKPQIWSAFQKMLASLICWKSSEVEVATSNNEPPKPSTAIVINPVATKEETVPAAPSPRPKALPAVKEFLPSPPGSDLASTSGTSLHKPVLSAKTSSLKNPLEYEPQNELSGAKALQDFMTIMSVAKSSQGGMAFDISLEPARPMTPARQRGCPRNLRVVHKPKGDARRTKAERKQARAAKRRQEHQDSIIRKQKEQVERFSANKAVKEELILQEKEQKARQIMEKQERAKTLRQARHQQVIEKSQHEMYKVELARMNSVD